MQPHTRPLASTLAALAALAVWPSPASALDAWRDRRGPLAGIAVGGGAGVSETDENLQGGREGVGMFGLARAGGGLNERLTLDASVSWFYRPEKIKSLETTSSHVLVAAAANFFFTKNLFARAGIGVGPGTLADEYPDRTREVSSWALGYLAGGGIEFFLNSDLAASFTVQYQQHVFSKVRFTGLVGFAGLTWY